MNKKKTQITLFFVFLAIILAVFLLNQKFDEKFEIEILRQSLRQFGIWAPAVFVIAYAILTIFSPSTPFMAAAGILFGFKVGLLLTVIGGILSAILVFFLARKLGQRWINKILKSRYLKYAEKYNQRLESRGIWDLIILRMLPIMPFNVLNILMGVSRISFLNYTIGTLLGLAPSNLIAVYFGDIIAKIF